MKINIKIKRVLNFLKDGFHGLCMACADSVPGVSGGTVAFLMGFYERFVGSINSLVFGKRHEKLPALLYLMRLGIGWAVAFWRVVYVQYMDESLEDGRLLFSAGNETDDFRRIENKFSGLFSSSSSFEDSGDSSSSVASDLMPDSTVNTENEAFSLNINGIFFVKEPLSVRGENYSILIFGYFDWNEDEGNEAVFKLVLAAVVILVFAAVFATNSFLTRFIVKKIQSPLEILERGVKNISDGNLSYRINYSGDDEFLPICKAFNSMAARLAELSEAQKKDEKNPGAS